MTPANAFAPGSPAGGAPSFQNMTLPPLQLSNTANSRSGDISAAFRNDSSGFTVNYGNGNSGGGVASDVKTQLLVAAIVGGAIWAFKKYK